MATENQLKYWASMKGKPHGHKTSNGKTWKWSVERLNSHIAWNRGKKMSDEYRKKNSAAHMGLVPWNKGKKTGPLSIEHRRRLSIANSGERHARWLGGISGLKKRARGTMEWKEWRTSVFVRDNFTCKECGVHGGHLEPHHIIPIRSDWSKLFDTNNGITLCRPCHKKTMWREEKFAGRYTALLTKV